MALMTPRGLKIRLELDWAFTLMGRLWQNDQQTDAFRVLRTVEAIEHIPTVLAFAGGVITAFVPQLPIWCIAVGSIVGTSAGAALTQAGMFGVLRPLGIMFVARAWSYLPGFGEAHVLVLAVLVFVRGWLSVPIWVAGLVVGGVLRYVLEAALVSRHFKLLGQVLTSSEVNFFNAYRLHADRLGIPSDITVSESEIEDGVWYACLVDYAEKYPESVARFPLTKDDQALLASVALKEG